eukprot:10854-Heterococcus_DN1.PRE.2
MVQAVNQLAIDTLFRCNSITGHAAIRNISTSSTVPTVQPAYIELQDASWRVKHCTGSIDASHSSTVLYRYGSLSASTTITSTTATAQC